MTNDRALMEEKPRSYLIRRLKQLVHVDYPTHDTVSILKSTKMDCLTRLYSVSYKGQAKWIIRKCSTCLQSLGQIRGQITKIGTLYHLDVDKIHLPRENMNCLFPLLAHQWKCLMHHCFTKLLKGIVHL